MGIREAVVMKEEVKEKSDNATPLVGKWRKGPGVMECRWPPEVGKSKEINGFSSKASRKNTTLTKI